ncbi:MAG: ribosome maturation factor RimP [Nitrospira sp.]|nr:ribosome maturation factor RimP [Nitrospira sp.]
MPTFLFGHMSKDVWLSMPGDGSEPVADRLQKIVSPILWTLGLELVDVVCVGQGSRSVVRVLINKPGGVTIADCEQAHKALGPALDVADPFPHAYTLEVSSPGLDRPFKGLQDYQRAIGKEVILKLREPLEGQWKITGRLMNADEQAVVLDLIMSKMTKSIRLDREVIAEAKLVVRP